MEFRGFEILPVGDTKIEVLPDRVRVYNLSNSGLDGVQILVKDAKTYSIKYGDMSHITEPNATIRSASLMKDAFGQVVTIMETYKRFDAETKTVMFGANTSFLQDNFEIIGLLDGKEIFKYNNNDVCVVKKALVKIPWRNIIKGIKNAFGAFSFVYTLWEIYQELRSKQTVTGHPIYVMGEDGRLYVVGHEVIITYDPVSFPANINDKEYQIDSIQFRFERKYDEPRIKPMYTKVGEQITLYNIPYIDIEDILAE